MYVHDDDYFRMAGDGLFQKMFANALLYFFVISLIKISFILVVDTHREKKERSRGWFLLLSTKNCIEITRWHFTKASVVIIKLSLASIGWPFLEFVVL